MNEPQAVKYMLLAQDMERALTFYRDVMGFDESFSSPHWSELRCGDAILALHGGGDGSRNETGLSLQYEELRVAFDRAVKSGATALQYPEQQEGEPIILSSFADPEGNVIMLTQYLGHDSRQPE